MAGGRVRASLGALVEREYRLLFAATLVTSLGDAIALIALAFAVLDVSSRLRARHRARGSADGERRRARVRWRPVGSHAAQPGPRRGVAAPGDGAGGVLVVALSPGWALAVDSLSFFACALLMARIRIAPRLGATHERFITELREGWHEFRSRTWLWSTVILFGIGNLFFTFWQVLGPAIADERLGGAGAWATILTAAGVGALIGALVVMRYRPRRPLVACILWSLAPLPAWLTLAAGAPTWTVALVSVISGAGMAIHVTLWFTIFQREIPEHAQSRVASLDAFGSFVLGPLGAAIAGPVALAIGSSGALVLAAGAVVTGSAAMLMIRDVWRIRPLPESRAVAPVG